MGVHSPVIPIIVTSPHGIQYAVPCEYDPFMGRQKSQDLGFFFVRCTSCPLTVTLYLSREMYRLLMARLLPALDSPGVIRLKTARSLAITSDGENGFTT